VVTSPGKSAAAPAAVVLPPPGELSMADNTGATPKDWDLAVMFNKMFGLDDIWDSAQGIAVEFRYWPEKQWGLGVTLAVNDWEGGGQVVDIPFTEFNEMTADGATLTYQIGVMGSYRCLLSEHYALLAHLGISYLTSDSSTSLSTSYTDHFGRHVSYELYMDNVSCLMGSAGLAIRKDEFLGYARCFGQVGIDVQGSLVGNNVEWLRESMESNFDAIVLRLGVGSQY
jgi:hypothetical protein